MFKKVDKLNHKLKISIEESPDQNHSRDNQTDQQNSFSGSDCDNNDSHSIDESDDCGTQDNNSHGSQNNQQEPSDNSNDENQRFEQNQEYLILEPSNDKLYEKLSKYSYEQGNQRKNIQSLEEQADCQKDVQVERIIHAVLQKRNFKVKEKEVLRSILESSQNEKKIQSYFDSIKSFEDKGRVQDPLLPKNQKNYIKLKQNSHLSSKCKQLEDKINQLTKKYQKTQNQNFLKIENQLNSKQIVKINRNKSKFQKSLQNLEKRLAKALNLNKNLSKRIKIQKNKFYSNQFLQSSSLNSKRFIKNEASINQESTIRNVDNNSILDNSTGKNCIQNTFRSAQSYMSDLKGSSLLKNQSQMEKNSIKNPQNQQFSDSNYPKIKKASDLNQNKSQHINLNDSAQIVNKKTPNNEKYRSPILQFNSYMINQKQSPTKVKSKQNIYIQDDMNLSQKPNEDSSVNNLCRSNKRQELEYVMNKYNEMKIQENRLLLIVEQNSRKIRFLEDQYLSKAIEIL